MEQLLQALLLGLLIGGVYALMASGLTLVFGVMNIVNVAHGATLIAAATVTWWVWDPTGIDPLLIGPPRAPVMFGVGWLAYRGVVSRISTESVSMSVLLTFGIALTIEGLLNVVAGNKFRSATPSYFDESFRIGGLVFPKAQVYGVTLAVVTLGGLYLVLTRTWTGPRHPRHLPEPLRGGPRRDQRRRLAALTFAIGTATTGVGGSILSVLYPFFPASHYDWISRLLGIIVLGGMGSLPGALVGALLLGLAETMTATYGSLQWATLVVLPGDPGRPARPAAGALRDAAARGRGRCDRRSLLSPRPRPVVLVGALALLLFPVVRPYDIYPQTVMLLAFLLADPGRQLEHHLRVRRLHLAGPQRVPGPRRLHRGDRRHAPASTRSCWRRSVGSSSLVHRVCSSVRSCCGGGATPS